MMPWRVAMGWSAALSDLLLAQSLLASGESPDAALAMLRTALEGFRHEGDLSNMLVVLHNGALAPVAAGHPERADRLRIEVYQHTVRHGIRLPQTYAAGTMPDGWYSVIPAGEPPDLAATAGLLQDRPLCPSWTD